MGYGIRLELWGDYALFSRPELRVERVSYDIITPSAARGILEAIFWKPAICYKIDRIHLLSPIRFTNVRRNEVSAKIPAEKARKALQNPDKAEPLYRHTQSSIAQRASMLLREVRYVVEAHFEMTDKAGPGDNTAKFHEMLHRRVQSGQCYHQPYLGCREFPAHFRLYEEETIETAYPGETRDLGLMLYDMDYSSAEGISPLFFRAVLESGVVQVAGCEVYR